MMQKRPVILLFTAALLSSLGTLINNGLAGAQGQLPAPVVRLLDQAGRLERKGQASLAIAYCNQAIALAPKVGYLYQNRGEMHSRANHFEPAIKDFDQALALDKRLTKVYLRRAWAYDQLDNFAAAAKDYQYYISLNPNAPDQELASLCLADNLGQMGQTDQAIKVLNKLLEKNPKCGQARRVRGLLLNSDNGNPKQAIADFNVAIEVKTEHYRDLYALRATAYTRLKEYAKAIADYTTVLKLSPNDDNASRRRGAVYELMGDYKKAITDYTSGIENNMDGAGPFYFARARCYKKLGQNILAQKDLEECKRLHYDGK